MYNIEQPPLKRAVEQRKQKIRHIWLMKDAGNVSIHRVSRHMKLYHFLQVHPVNTVWKWSPIALSFEFRK